MKNNNLKIQNNNSNTENNNFNTEINSYLCYKGYALYKNSLTLKQQLFIRDELTMKPYVQNSLGKANTFPIYLESEKKLYVPRYWGINNFGIPKKIKLKPGKNINVEFRVICI